MDIYNYNVYEYLFMRLRTFIHIYTYSCMKNLLSGDTKF